MRQIDKLALRLEDAPCYISLRLWESEFQQLSDLDCQLLASWGLRFQKEAIKFKLYETNKEIYMALPKLFKPVAANVVAGQALDLDLFSDGQLFQRFGKSEVEAIVALEQTEKPAVLLELVSGKQRWCNQAASDILQLSPEEILKLRSYEHWLDGEVDKLWTEVRSGLSEFELVFNTIHCNSGDQLEMKTNNRILELSDGFYRFSEVLDAKVVKSREEILASK